MLPLYRSGPTGALPTPRLGDPATRHARARPVHAVCKPGRWTLGTAAGAAMTIEGSGGTFMSIIAWLVVGAIAGWLAGYLVRGDEGLGIIGRIVLGIVGAIVGGFLAGILTGEDYTTGINIPTIIVATIGAVITVVVVGMFRGGTRTGRGVI